MSTIDIAKNKNNDINNLINNKIDELIEDDSNNYELKISLLNVDSRFRNKIPKNIIDSNSKFLENNPIYVTKDSNEIKINYNNHDLKLGDQIILKNIKNNDIKLRNAVYLNISFNYFLIKVENHSLLSNYNNNFKLNLIIDDKIDNNDRMIGNIPLNSIIGIHNIYILKENNDENISDDMIDNLISNLDITKERLIKDYIFIKLPFNYSNENKLNNNTEFKEFENIKKIINIQYLNIGCIELNYINSDYPINNNQYQSYHEITKVEDNYIYFNIGKTALYTENNGGSNVYIGKIINTIEGYPDANNYTLDLKKSFTNIVRIELVTSEVPYIDFNIKNTINSSNNTIHWKYLEDGDYIYSANINQGNYTPTNLILKLQEKMNLVERISSTETTKIFNIFKINFDNNSEEMKFTAFKNNLLPNSLTIEKDITLGTEVLKLNIKQNNNFINIGDTIIISGSIKIGDVPASVINTSHVVYDVNNETDIYSVIIPVDSDKSYNDINITGSGGQNIKIQIPARVSLLLNQLNSIGSLLGFKNVGESFAVTPYLHIISNFTDYIEPIIFDEIGNKNPSSSLINLNGNNYYMLLYLNDFEGLINDKDFDNSFSKILLMGNPGDIMFNTFVNSPLEFDIPISSLEQLKVKFLFPDRTSPDFRNFDHSFTLRIVEKITKPSKTRLNPNKTSYEDSLIQIYNN
jgi:hypothetical protein